MIATLLYSVLFLNCFFLSLGWFLFAALRFPPTPPLVERKAKKVPQKTSKKVSPQILSDRLILVEAATGKVLRAKKADKRARPASLTKIMTALLVTEKIKNLDQKVTVPKRIARQLEGRDIATAGFKGGERVKAKDLLYGILFASGAECSMTMAEKVAGSEKKFVKKMNRKAKKLAMTRTNFGNSVGLDRPPCYTTVRDMAKLVAYALKNKTFRKVFTGHTYRVKPTNKTKKTRILVNKTLAMFGENTRGAFGGKRGYTPKAGYCLATVANVNGKEYICVSTGARTTKTQKNPQVKDARTVYKAIKIAP